MRVEWREVTSLPGLLASADGYLMVQPYEQSMPHGGLGRYGGYQSRGVWDGVRYIYRYRGKTYRVARLICEAFHGLAPLDRPYCLHRDEDARNNAAENLMWGTQKENLNAPGFLRYCRSRIGANSPTAKYRTRQVSL